MGRSHTQKRVRQIKKKMVQGLLDPQKEDMFSLFVAGTDITYCYYHESERILGRTFGMCVLQVPSSWPPYSPGRQAGGCRALWFAAEDCVSPQCLT